MALTISLKFVLGAVVFSVAFVAPLLPSCPQPQCTRFGDPNSQFLPQLLLFSGCLLQGDGYFQVLPFAALLHLHFPVSQSDSEPSEVERWCKSRASLLQRTDVPGREGRNTDGGNGV